MKKKFDAVKFQRKVRKNLSAEYLANPEAFMQRLKKKYGQAGKQRLPAK